MDRERRIRLALVVPCFQEESALPRTNDVLTSLLLKMSEAGLVGDDSYIVYVDDGSTDGTWGLISGYACCRVKGIRLSRNFGHQYALLAGMEYVAGNCDACVTIDADLQDDPSVIPDMVRAYMDGSEIVLSLIHISEPTRPST